MKLLIIVAGIFISTLPVTWSGFAHSDSADAKARKYEVTKRRVLRAMKRDLSRADQHGYVYKSPYFWQYFSDPRRMEVLFNGQFVFKGAIDQAYLTEFVGSYVIDRNNLCREKLRGPLTTFNIKKWTEHTRRGVTTKETPTVDSDVLVEHRFIPYFERYVTSGIPPRDMIDAIYQLGKQYDIRKIPGEMFRGTLGKYMNANIDSTKALLLLGCESPAATQLEENLLRALDGRQSIQEEKAPVAGARHSSDRGFFEGQYASIGEACMAEFAFRGREIPHVLPYCVCAEKALMKGFNADQAITYTADFWSVYDDKELDVRLNDCRR